MELMSAVLERGNMMRAYERVLRNKGTAGVDGMTVGDLKAHLKAHWPEIREQLHETPFMDIAIDQENAAIGGETFELDIFPKGMFLIAFKEDQHLANKIIQNLRLEGHHVVDDDTLYGAPNNDGLLLMSETGPATGRVRQLLKHFTTASFTTEYCDINLTDETPDAERVEPQMAAIRGMFP